MSNLFISSLRKIIPSNIRIPAFVVVIATFTTIVQMVLKAFLPALDKSLGIFIPLIVVNCIVFARAEAFASVNPVTPSILDGLSMGAGFTIALMLLSSVREILGVGTWFGIRVMPAGFQPVSMLTQPPGGFITLGILLALVNAVMKAVGRRAAAKEGCC